MGLVSMGDNQSVVKRHMPFFHVGTAHYIRLGSHIFSGNQSELYGQRDNTSLLLSHSEQFAAPPYHPSLYQLFSGEVGDESFARA